MKLKIEIKNNFIPLRQFVEIKNITSVFFGPNDYKPFDFADFYCADEFIIRAYLSKAIRQDQIFNQKLMERDLSILDIYQICQNGHKGKYYLTLPGCVLV